MTTLRAALVSLPFLLLLGCPPGDTGKIEDTDPGSVDADGDGYPAGEDCDDSDPSINPEAYEDLLEWAADSASACAHGSATALERR